MLHKIEKTSIFCAIIRSDFIVLKNVSIIKRFWDHYVNIFNQMYYFQIAIVILAILLFGNKKKVVIIIIIKCFRK